MKPVLLVLFATVAVAGEIPKDEREAFLADFREKTLAAMSAELTPGMGSMAEHEICYDRTVFMDGMRVLLPDQVPHHGGFDPEVWRKHCSRVRLDPSPHWRKLLAEIVTHGWTATDEPAPAPVSRDGWPGPPSLPEGVAVPGSPPYPGPRAPNGDTYVLHAMEALAFDGRAWVRPHLEEYVRTRTAYPERRWRALYALRELGSRLSVPLFREVAKEQDSFPLVKRLASTTLAELERLSNAASAPRGEDAARAVGWLRDAEGRGLPGREVEAVDRPIGRVTTEGRLGEDPPELWEPILTITGPDGGFVFENLRPGLRYHFVGADGRAGPFYPEPGETLEALVESPPDPQGRRSLGIRVLGPGGQPVLTADVSLVNVGGGIRSTGNPGPGGRAREPVVSAAEQLYVEVAYAVDIRGRTLGARIAGPFDPAITEVLVQADQAHEVAGRVTGPDEVGVSGVRVRAVPVHELLFPADEGSSSFHEHGAALTDAEGRFEIGGLGSGEYMLWTEVPIDWVYPPAVRVKAGAKEIEVKLRAAVKAVITVLDADGRPVAGAEVAVFEEQEEGGFPPPQLHLITDPKGRTPFVGLDPDRPYWIMVKPPPGRDDLTPEFLEVWDWKPMDTTVEFGRAR